MVFNSKTFGQVHINYRLNQLPRQNWKRFCWLNIFHWNICRKNMVLHTEAQWRNSSSFMPLTILSSLSRTRYTPSSASSLIVLQHTHARLMREREMFYLTMHSTHFIYSYMVSDIWIWLWTILIVRKETRCHHIGYSYRLTARVLLHAPSHRQDSTYHSLFLHQSWSTGWNDKLDEIKTLNSTHTREREMFYLTMHSTHFIYGYIASYIWLRERDVAQR